MKKTGIIFGVILLLLAITYFILDEPKPKGSQTEKADQVAKKMQEAINHQAWLKTGAVSWSFKGKQFYVWDKKRHYAKVNWNDYEVLVNINNRVGVAHKNGVKLSGKDNAEAVNKAWKYWVNASFWLNPISKVFDPGTSRQLVPIEGNQQDGLLVTYASGGATPGDSYLWILDDTFLPEKWKFWVSIIPLGGMEFSWDRWITTETGVKLSTYHEGLFLTIDIGNVKTANEISNLVPGEDPFKELEEASER